MFIYWFLLFYCTACLCLAPYWIKEYSAYGLFFTLIYPIVGVMVSIRLAAEGFKRAWRWLWRAK